MKIYVYVFGNINQSELISMDSGSSSFAIFALISFQRSKSFSWRRSIKWLFGWVLSLRGCFLPSQLNWFVSAEFSFPRRRPLVVVLDIGLFWTNDGKVGVSLLLLLFFLFVNKGFHSLFDLSATIADLFHPFSALSWAFSWVDSFSTHSDFPLDISATRTNILHVSAVSSGQFLTWKSKLSPVSTDWSWSLPHNFFRGVSLNTILSASSAVVNWVLGLNSSPDVVNWVISFHFGHDSDVVLSFRNWLAPFGRLIGTVESIFQKLWTILSHLRRIDDLRNFWSEVIGRGCSPEFSFGFRFSDLSFIFGSWKCFFQTFQIFWNEDGLEETSFVIVLLSNFVNRHISESGWVTQEFRCWNSLSGLNFQALMNHFPQVIRVESWKRLVYAPLNFGIEFFEVVCSKGRSQSCHFIDNTT